MGVLSNPAIETIREITRGTGYEGRLFLVGGVVRDKVMGRLPTEDVDIVLEGDALELAHFLYAQRIADHKPVVYPRFGTAMVSIKGHTVELVSARRESYGPESRKPEVELAELKEDILRRDFTINTLLENLHTGEIMDLTGCAMTDIEAGIIRTPTDPQTTFYDDPLRMLRAVRFAVRLGFDIEEETCKAILRDAPRLAIVSRERIRDEFVKILLSDQPGMGLRMLKELRLLKQFAHEFIETQGVTQDGGHIYDVWEHTLHALDSLPSDADLTLRLAVLFHDVGKPRTKSVDDEGHSHFYGHEDLSAETTRRVMNRLRFPTNETARVIRLVELHMRIGEYRREWKEAAVKRLIRDAGGDIADLLRLARADRAGAQPNASMVSLNELERRIAETMLSTTVAEMESPLDGKEIMDLLGIAPGPEVKEVKEWLTDQVIEGRLTPRDKENAKKMALARFGSGSAGI